MAEAYIAAEFAKLIANYFENKHLTGIPRPKLLREQINDPFERLPISVLNAYAQKSATLARQGSEEWIIAEYIINNSQEMFTYALRSAENIAGASKTTSNFMCLITDVGVITHQYCKDGSIILTAKLVANHTQTTIFLFQILVATGMLMLLSSAKKYSSETVQQLAIRNYSESLDKAASLLGFPDVCYTTGNLMTIYNKAFAQSNNPNADPRLSAILSRELSSKINRLPESGNLVEQLRHFLQMHIQDSPSLDDACDYFHQSRRSMSRHLKNEGISFKKIVNEVRSQKVRELIDTNLPLKKIAALSGFKSLSSFTCSFKEWFGTTPSSYRSSRNGNDRTLPVHSSST